MSKYHAYGVVEVSSTHSKFLRMWCWTASAETSALELFPLLAHAFHYHRQLPDTICRGVPLEKLPSAQLFNNIPAFYGTRGFTHPFSQNTAAFPIPSQFNSVPTLTTIFSENPPTDHYFLPCRLLAYGFTTTICTISSSQSCYITRPSHPAWFHTNLSSAGPCTFIILSHQRFFRCFYIAPKKNPPSSLTQCNTSSNTFFTLRSW